LMPVLKDATVSRRCPDSKSPEKFRVQGQGSKFRVQGSGFRVQGSKFKVRSLWTVDVCDRTTNSEP
jgi:hypothetical protein